VVLIEVHGRLRPGQLGRRVEEAKPAPQPLVAPDRRDPPAVDDAADHLAAPPLCRLSSETDQAKARRRAVISRAMSAPISAEISGGISGNPRGIGRIRDRG